MTLFVKGPLAGRWAGLAGSTIVSLGKQPLAASAAVTKFPKSESSLILLRCELLRPPYPYPL